MYNCKLTIINVSLWFKNGSNCILQFMFVKLKLNSYHTLLFKSPATFTTHKYCGLKGVRTFATMATETINLGSLLSVCIDAAQKAGNEIRKVWKSGDLGTKDKGGDDPLTKADVSSQQLIMGILQKKWPKLQMVGEEDCPIPPTHHEPNTSLVDLSKVPTQYTAVDAKDVCVFRST